MYITVLAKRGSDMSGIAINSFPTRVESETVMYVRWETAACDASAIIAMLVANVTSHCGRDA